MRFNDFKKAPVKEVEIDNRNGRGAVPNNMEIDYFGLRVKMKPSTFLSLAAPLGRDASDEMKDYIRGGGSIGAPFLIINIPDDNDQPAEVVGHEGRNRMLAVMAVEGDEPIETHLFFRGAASRARHITPDVIRRLNKEIRQENTGKMVRGPFWNNGQPVAEEKLNEIFDQVYNWNWDDATTASFKTADGRQVKVDFNEASPDNWSVDFTVDGDYHITGGGDAIAILSTVQDAIIDFITQEDIGNLRFKADQEGGNSRSKFYLRWANKIARLTGMQVDHKTKGPTTVFHLYRAEEMTENEIEIRKPDPDQTLGIARKDMPQVKRDHYPELIAYLEDHGNKFTNGTIDARKLKAVQSEFSDAGVRKMMDTGGRPSDSAGKDPKPLIVSSDNYIVDGHHRWLAAWNQGQSVPIMRSNLPIQELFQLIKDFPHTTYKDIHENMSVTGTDHHKEEQRRGITPGSEAWFKHWFSRPYMKREQLEHLKTEAINYFKGVRNEKTNHSGRPNSKRRADERRSKG